MLHRLAEREARGGAVVQGCALDREVLGVEDQLARALSNVEIEPGRSGEPLLRKVDIEIEREVADRGFIGS